MHQINSHSINLDSLITSLHTKERKEKFLIDLLQRDQEVRDSDKKLEILKRNNYDMKSEEFQNYARKMVDTDSINFLKAKKYLEAFGYPDYLESDSKANYALNVTALHQPFKRQLVLFPYIYKAYNDGLINSERFSFFLNKMHIHKYGESHPHAITYEENIEQLLDKLQLK